MFISFSIFSIFKSLQRINLLYEISHCHCNCTMMHTIPLSSGHHVIITYSNLTKWNYISSWMSSFLLVAKWPNVQGVIWTLETSLQQRVMAAFLKLGNWPPHESVERYLLCFHCSIRLCMNFFHLLAYWAKSSLNAKVFIMAVERVAGSRSPLMFHWLPGEDWI